MPRILQTTWRPALKQCPEPDPAKPAMMSWLTRVAAVRVVSVTAKRCNLHVSRLAWNDDDSELRAHGERVGKKT